MPLRAYAGANLFYIGSGVEAVEVAGNDTGYTDLFRSIDDDDTIAEGVKAGLIEDGGFEEEEWWID